MKITSKEIYTISILILYITNLINSTTTGTTAIQSTTVASDSFSKLCTLSNIVPVKVN